MDCRYDGICVGDVSNAGDAERTRNHAPILYNAIFNCSYEPFVRIITKSFVTDLHAGTDRERGKQTS